jgi:hypothetical protein
MQLRASVGTESNGKSQPALLAAVRSVKVYDPAFLSIQRDRIDEGTRPHDFRAGYSFDALGSTSRMLRLRFRRGCAPSMQCSHPAGQELCCVQGAIQLNDIAK